MITFSIVGLPGSKVSGFRFFAYSICIAASFSRRFLMDTTPKYSPFLTTIIQLYILKMSLSIALWETFSSVSQKSAIIGLSSMTALIGLPIKTA